MTVTDGRTTRSGGSRPVIEVRHLTKRYGAILAVDDLSFTVAAGQVTGFLGPNGSGKSTTMGMIVGLDAPTAGAWARFLVEPVEAVSFVMSQKMLRGIRDRANTSMAPPRMGAAESS